MKRFDPGSKLEKDEGPRKEGDREEEVPAPGDVKKRRIHSGPRRRKPRAVVRDNAAVKAEEDAKKEAEEAAKAASKAPEGDFTSTNQGLPGSGEESRPVNETEAGQRHQDWEDEIWSDPRIVHFKAQRDQQEDELRAHLADARAGSEWRQRELDKALKELKDLRVATSEKLTLSEQAANDTNAAAAADKERLQTAERLVAELNKLNTDFDQQLAGITRQKHQLEAEKDEAAVITKGLQERIDVLESEAAAHETVATEKAALQEQVAEVHSSFEDVFSDMAEGLTIDEKFAYVRELQTALADRAVEPPETEPVQMLSLSGIRSIDITPVSAAAPAPVAAPFAFTGITSVETTPVAPVAAAVPVAPPLDFSSLTTVETTPVAPVAVPAPVAAPFAFTGISTVETAPAAPAAVSAESAPVAAPLAFSSITSIETAPVAPAPVQKPTPQIRVQWRTRKVYEQVDRPVVPLWMWFLFLVGIVACASGFAGLLRENLIWLDANDLAYQRLMGAEQETLLASVSMGVQGLFPGMGGIGHSLFG